MERSHVPVSYPIVGQWNDHMILGSYPIGGQWNGHMILVYYPTITRALFQRETNRIPKNS